MTKHFHFSPISGSPLHLFFLRLLSALLKICCHSAADVDADGGFTLLFLLPLIFFFSNFLNGNSTPQLCSSSCQLSQIISNRHHHGGRVKKKMKIHISHLSNSMEFSFFLECLTLRLSSSCHHSGAFKCFLLPSFLGRPTFHIQWKWKDPQCIRRKKEEKNFHRETILLMQLWCIAQKMFFFLPFSCSSLLRLSGLECMIVSGFNSLSLSFPHLVFIFIPTAK